MHIDITYILHIYNNHTHPHGHAKPEPWNIRQKSLIFLKLVFIQPTENVYLKIIISTTFTALLYSLFTFYVGKKITLMM